MEQTEIWTVMKSPLSKYSVSELGHLKNNKTNTLLNFKICENNGYIDCVLYDDSNNKVHRKMHRLVGEYYLENPDNKPFVNCYLKCKFSNLLFFLFLSR